MNNKRELVIYIVCGAIAACLNLGVFYLLDHVLGVHYLLATSVAWLCSTTFAFMTNKFLVFRAYDLSRSVLAREIVTFLSSRGISGLMDLVGMYVLVSLLEVEHGLAKVVVLCMIVATNYILSKYWVFKKGTA
ncbi:GtrA family protein [Selenomonas ruminantium]|uniref:GtrA family protein n=1 Tax=Selenomonas ruminantium TaxID=971 RepID=UPI00047B1588|nr:GtrA family protein [Selenomonas ruminantium]